MGRLTRVASGLLALSASVSAQDWVNEVAQSATHRAMVRGQNGEFIALSKDTFDSDLRVEVFTSTGYSQTALRIASASGGDLYGLDACLGHDGSLIVVGQHVGMTGTFPWISSWDVHTGALLWEDLPLDPATSGLTQAGFFAVEAIPGGYLLGGAGHDSSHVSQSLVVSCDEFGSIQWRRIIGQFSLDSRVVDLVSTGDGGAVLAINDDGKARIVRISASGSPLWSRRFIDVEGSLLHVQVSHDGDFLVAGHSQQPNSGVWVAELTPAGAIGWQKSYSMTSVATAMAASPNGGAFLSTTSLGQPALMQIDDQGQVLAYRRQPGGVGGSTNATILAHDDGGAHVRWSVDHGTTESYLARYGGQSLGKICSAEMSAIDSSAATTIFPVSAVVAQAKVIPFGSGSGLTTTATAAGLTVLDYCGDACTYPSAYCEGAPNSAGAGARMDSSGGSLSVFANDFGLLTTGLPASKPGIYIYGASPTAIPFGDGTLCIAPPIKRLPIVFSDAGGVATHAFDVSSTPVSEGSTWYFQLWYRDPDGAGAGFNMSDGLTTTWCP